MENKNIIIILVAVIIVLVAIEGFMFFQSINAKEPTKVKITSDNEQYEGGELYKNCCAHLGFDHMM